VVAFDETGGFEVAEALGEPLWGDVAEGAREVGEAGGPAEEVPDDEEGPLLADYLEGARDGAEVLIRLRFGHDSVSER